MTSTQDPSRSDPAPPAWDDRELAADPHANQDKATKVRSMFAAIAGSYDLNNRVHSLWRDQAWRRLAVRTADVRAGDVVADIACGTGDLTEAFAKSPAERVLGIDYTHEMLDLAEQKRARLDRPRHDKITYIEGDAQRLPLGAESVDVLSIAFGIRNVQDPARALREFWRVLRPGGRLIILEFGTPSLPPLRWFNDFYCGWVMPRTATLISGDRSGAYRYLPKSVGSFWERDRMLSELESAGFTDRAARSLTLGICWCYRAVRPEPS
ncbi:MAG: ubiquinone/menaquinone biosynthesis methyltransferase [Planctomycetota bacterium]